MYGQDRNQMRQMYVDAWRKYRAAEPMQPLEQLIADIIAMHPEYHAMLEQTESVLDKDFHPGLGQQNPFLHMGMHIAIREQLSTDRPEGIVTAYNKLITKTKDHHEAQHHVMECLGKMLWETQRNDSMPDEAGYLHCIEKLAQS